MRKVDNGMSAASRNWVGRPFKDWYAVAGELAYSHPRMSLEAGAASVSIRRVLQCVRVRQRQSAFPGRLQDEALHLIKAHGKHAVSPRGATVDPRSDREARRSLVGGRRLQTRKPGETEGPVRFGNHHHHAQECWSGGGAELRRAKRKGRMARLPG